MKIDIIDDNYINSYKYSFIWKWFLYLIALIYLLRITNIVELPKLYETIFNFSIGLIIIVSLINAFIFIRIGHLEFIDNKFTYQLYNTNEVIEIKKVTCIKISSSQKNQYLLTFNETKDFLVELKKNQLEEFKSKCAKKNIKTITSSSFGFLKKWFLKTKT